MASVNRTRLRRSGIRKILRNFSSMSVFPLQALPPFESFCDHSILEHPDLLLPWGKPRHPPGHPSRSPACDPLLAIPRSGSPPNLIPGVDSPQSIADVDARSRSPTCPVVEPDRAGPRAV